MATVGIAPVELERPEADIVSAPDTPWITLVWNDPDDSAASFRKIQGDTYRVAAAVAEGSVGDRWCINVDAGCSYIGGTRKATVIKIELAHGDAGEMARAEALLRKVAQDIKN